MEVLEEIQCRATTLVKQPRTPNYAERLHKLGLTIQENRRLRRDLTETLKIITRRDRFHSDSFFSLGPTQSYCMRSERSLSNAKSFSQPSHDVRKKSPSPLIRFRLCQSINQSINKNPWRPGVVGVPRQMPPPWRPPIDACPLQRPWFRLCARYKLIDWLKSHAILESSFWSSCHSICCSVQVKIGWIERLRQLKLCASQPVISRFKVQGTRVPMLELNTSL